MARYLKQNLRNALGDSVSVVLAFYFLASVLLSTSILMRLQIIMPDFSQLLNVLLYYFVYCVMPMVALVFLAQNVY